MKNTADKLIDQREDQENQDHAAYLKQVSDRNFRTSRSEVNKELLKEEIANEASRKAPEATALQNAQQNVATLRAVHAAQNSPFNIRVISEQERVTLEMIRRAEADVVYLTPKPVERTLPTVAEAQAQYLKPDNTPMEVRQAITPGPCPRCGQQLKNITVASHIDFAGDRCILDLKRVYQSGIITTEQYNNLRLLQDEESQ